MTTFDPQPTLDDFAEFRALLADFWANVPDKAWNTRTGKRDKDWTLHQALAHLVSIAVLFNHAVDVTIDDQPLEIVGLKIRRDLRHWNDIEIAARVAIPPDGLVDQLLAELDGAVERLGSLTAEEVERTTFVRAYNRPARVIDYIDWQLSHAGVVHAAQITRPLNAPPLWERYSTPLKQRQIDRFLRHFSYSYWNEVGDDLYETINFHIDGDSGGAWHIVAAPDGGSVDQGLVEDAGINLHFRDADTLFGVFNVHIPFQTALESGVMRIDGDSGRAMQVIRLFGASPPKV
jgi:hypothetical protein